MKKCLLALALLFAVLLSGWDSPSLIKGGGSDWDLTLFTCTWSGYSRVTVRLVYS